MTGPFLVLFDIDGTLVDSQAHILASMDAAHVAAGTPRPPREAVLEVVGLSLPQAMAALHPGAPEATRAALVAGYRGAFSGLRATTLSPLYPGIADLVPRLAADPRFVLGAATGKSRRGLDAVLAAHGLSGCFATLQTADDHPSKPHPSMILAALAETGTPPERAVMVGDTEYDLAMARAAGVGAIAVAWGYHAAARLAAADAVAGDVADLERHLGALA
jgi:phosphoglycolate phosphatase